MTYQTVGHLLSTSPCGPLPAPCLGEVHAKGSSCDAPKRARLDDLRWAGSPSAPGEHRMPLPQFCRNHSKSTNPIWNNSVCASPRVRYAKIRSRSTPFDATGQSTAPSFQLGYTIPKLWQICFQMSSFGHFSVRIWINPFWRSPKLVRCPFAALVL